MTVAVVTKLATVWYVILLSGSHCFFPISAFFAEGALLFPSLESFTAICEAAGRKISTLKSEAVVLCHENSGLLALGEECRR